MRIRLLAAFPGADLGGYASQWVSLAHPSRRWAILAVGALQDLGLDRAELVLRFGDRVQLAVLPAACECCISAPVLGVSLVRLMRSGPWDELLVLADGRGHLPMLSQSLARALPRALPEALRETLHWEAPQGLMTPPQQILLSDPRRAGFEAAQALVQWAQGGVLNPDATALGAGPRLNLPPIDPI